MFKRLLISSTVLSVGLGVVLPVQALTFTEAPSGVPITGVEFSTQVSDWKRLKALRRIAELLSSDAQVDRDQGKMALARLLTIRPGDADALDLAGTLLMGEKKYKDAEQSFLRALKSEPERTKARAKLGTVLMMQGKLVDGEQQLRRVLQEENSNPLALRYLAWLEQQRGNPSAAVNYLEHLVGDQVPEEPNEVYLVLAELYNDLHLYQDTLALLKPYTKSALDSIALQSAGLLAAEASIQLKRTFEAQSTIKRLEKTLGKSDYRIDFLYAGLAKAQKKYADAEILLKGVIERKPELALSVYIQLAQLYAEWDDPAKAEQALRSAIKISKPEQLSGASGYLTDYLIGQGRAEEALRFQRQLVESHPQQIVLAYSLAELEVKAGNTDKALEILEQLLQREPRFAIAYWLASRQAERLGDSARARALVEKGLSIESKSPEGWVQAAGLDYRGGNRLRGIEKLEQGLRELPTDPWLLFELSQYHQSGGDHDNANRYYRQLIKRQPNHIPALTGLALNLANEEPGTDFGRQQALELAKSAYDLALGDPYVADAYGWALFKVEGAVSALSYLEKAAEDAPQTGEIRYHLAMVYAQQGRDELARRQLQTALELGVDSQLRGQIEAYLKP